MLFGFDFRLSFSRAALLLVAALPLCALSFSLTSHAQDHAQDHAHNHAQDHCADALSPLPISDLGIIPSGKYWDKNHFLKLKFHEWLKERSGAQPTGESERQFIKESQAALLDLPPLKNEQPVELANPLQPWGPTRPGTGLRSISFQGETFEVVALLGGALEGVVHLVKKNPPASGLAVIKVFHKTSTAGRHATLLKLLEKRGIPAVRLLAEDLNQKQLLLTYEKGLSWGELNTPVSSHHLFSGTTMSPRLAFQILHARFFNEVMVQVGAEVNSAASEGLGTSGEFGGTPFVSTGNYFFDPHIVNVIYQPESGSFVIIDPH